MSKTNLVKRLERLEEKNGVCPKKQIILKMWEPDGYTPGKRVGKIIIFPLTEESAKEYYAQGGTDEIIVEIIENKPKPEEETPA
jgi:hypothetical protein